MSEHGPGRRGLEESSLLTAGDSSSLATSYDELESDNHHLQQEQQGDDDDVSLPASSLAGISSQQGMGIFSPGSQQGSPSSAFASQALADHDEVDSAQFQPSPSKRGSRLGSTLAKLHFRHSSGHSKRDGQHAVEEGDHHPDGKGGSSWGLHRHSLDGGDAAGQKGGSKLSSGKHTPLGKSATGDFAEFLEAEQLKAALADEQEKAIKRDIKAAKHPKKQQKDSALGGKGKVQSPGDKIRTEAEEEERRRNALYTPEGPTLEERGYFPGDLRHHGHLAHRKDLPSRSHSFSSSRRKDGKARPPGICGDVSDSESSSSAYTDEAGEDDEAAAASPPKRKKRLSSSVASSSSSVSSDIAEPLVNPSVMSLKSWQSDQSGGAGSLASGGANQKLARPLLELEELELDSFLKNFGRHTREIRVPNSATFPRKRMPRWEDFKVPAGEAALAAAQGKRITVLTHVDRGLQMLAASEGQGIPPSRPTVPNADKKKKKGKADEHGEAAEPAGRTSQSHPRVTFAPEAGNGTKETQRPPSPEMPFAGLQQRSLEKDEKLAKKQEKEAAQAGQMDPVPAGMINIHDDSTEWRPSRDEAHLDEEDWEILNAQAAEGEEEEVQVPEDQQVDGIAWAIAYILAIVERYAPEELDNSPDQTYREGKTRSHIERLYLIAPFWERLLFGIRRVYRWDNPSRTASVMMIYFILWHLNLIPTAFMCMLIYYVCQFRFFPPSASYLHEQVRARMARGVDADRLAERLRRRSRLDVLEIYKRFVVAYGQGTQLACGDVADFHEKVKNLIVSRAGSAVAKECA